MFTLYCSVQDQSPVLAGSTNSHESASAVLLQLIRGMNIVEPAQPSWAELVFYGSTHSGWPASTRPYPETVDRIFFLPSNSPFYMNYDA